jgi:hypothetical protein
MENFPVKVSLNYPPICHPSQQVKTDLYGEINPKSLYFARPQKALWEVLED